MLSVQAPSPNGKKLNYISLSFEGDNDIRNKGVLIRQRPTGKTTDNLLH